MKGLGGTTRPTPLLLLQYKICNSCMDNYLNNTIMEMLLTLTSDKQSHTGSA